MSKVKFSIYSFVFILLSYITQVFIVNLDNGTLERFIIFVLVNVILYILYSYIILKFAKENLFTKKSSFLIFTLLVISFIVFPMIFQVMVWISCLVIASYNIEKGDSMSSNGKMSDSLSVVFGVIVTLFIMITYSYGGYKLIADEKYSKFELIVGFVLPPYPVYIGTKELYYKFQ